MRHNLPSSIVSGSTTEFTKRYALFTPDLWTLSYHLRGAAALDVTATAGDDNKSYMVTLVAAVDDEPLAPGQYFFQAYVTNIDTPSDKRLVDNGRIQVLPDLSSPDVETFDGRSNAEKMLEAIDAVMQKKALTGDQAAYTIGQRTLTRIPLDQLIEWRRYYEGIVQAELIQARIKKGQSPFTNILTEFKRPR